MAKVTIDDLALMMQKEFSFMHKEFDFMHQEFDFMHQKFDSIDKKFDSIDGSLGELKQGQMRLENQVSGIRDDLLAMRMEFNDIKATLARFEKRSLEDDDAIAFELEKLKKRVNVLEAKLKLVH